ncbi:hypothetical protein GYMLUDRAFT_72304 [Collybiopsis luxurians FD-317 M1]|uniref:Uncharacterized protein n=1 Tax=Collybiopsis luxurians FD-317 M1 TaxID=944289 RepID=A0A0D0CJS7_9AGAR|nr:hypothetical protein GYMLUDRAFT_72304 [Collybiopsis luxurians FD-317 M1]
MEDEDSLFGSPPSSPRIGRSPSPALALPSSESIVDLQNVGTIALPGSHCNSELSINPLAYVPQEVASQPPFRLQPNLNYSAACVSSPRSSVPSTPSSSRASSQAPSNGKRGRRKREHEPIVRPPPPEIPLPDPNAPPPVNWLRSQSALLGHAGLVGGVKPSTLSNRHSRGSTAVNPIVIHDNEAQNRAQDRPSLSGPTPTSSFSLSIPSELPPPSPWEVVQILLRQREIFSVLEDILKLVQGKHLKSMSVQSNQSAFTASTLGPALKRRKLNRVPAGAADWDVPYPFVPGEGPEHYSETWERDRQRQLILQLSSLIKSASRKAALRKYLEQNPHLQVQSAQNRNRSDLPASLRKEMEHAMPKVDGHYRPDTAFYGLPNLSSQDILVDRSNSPTKLDPCTQSSAVLEASPYDELLASLLTVTSSSNEAGSSWSDDTSLLANIGSKESTPELDQGVLDSWISIFQTFEMPALSEGTSTPNANFLEVSSVPDIPMQFHSFDTFSNVQDSQSFAPEFINPSMSAGTDGWIPSEADIIALQSLELDHTIDNSSLTRLNISIPATLSAASNLSALSGTPSLVHSPIPSLASFGDAELLTPELGSPDLFVSTGQTKSATTSLSTEMMADRIGGFDGGTSSEDVPMGLFEGPQGAQSGKMATSAERSIPELGVSGLLNNHPLFQPGTSSVFTPPAVRPFKASDRSSNKAELLERAKERRAQLAEELVKARTQLWETTIEHGVLTRLAKHYT